MPFADRGDIRIFYEETCGGDGPVLVLVAGLGEQIGTVEYPPEQCTLFAEQGFRVIRIDNRDAGLSGPDEKAGVVPAYSLLDVADDIAAVIQDLDCGPVHLVGASLGGYIVRWTTLRDPALIASLTVVMSGSGAGPDEDGPQGVKEAQPSLLGMMERRDRASQIDWSTENWRWLWGTQYPFPEEWVRAHVASGIDRAYRPEGIGRLLNAARTTPGLWEAQRTIACPTLVMHGGEDPIFPAEHGVAIAERIPNADLWMDPRMGHIMHQEQWAEMAERIACLARSAGG